MTIEEWRPILGYEGFYEASSFGRIRGITRTVPSGRGWDRTLKGRMLKQSKHTNGYLLVTLVRESQKRGFLVHRIIASAFMDNPKNKEQVNHIDSIRNNNNIENLEWATPSENSTHSYLFGESINKRILTKSQVKIIRETRDWSKSQKKETGINAFPYVWLAKCFGVNRATIKQAAERVTYREQ